jgi:Family of unknown function (DUF6289)
MKSSLIQRIQVLVFAIAITLTAVAFSPTSAVVAVTEQVTYHYYNGPDETSGLVGERVYTCDGHVQRWGQITQYYTVDTAPCP